MILFGIDRNPVANNSILFLIVSPMAGKQDHKIIVLTSLVGDVTFIASEIISENKIEFPRMADLFCADPQAMHPAGFVRASMSIPIFFKSHLMMVDTEDPRIREAWIHHFGSDRKIPRIARFVDGGMMSNFPINIFYNPRILEPRLPTLGIDLDDSVPEQANDATTWNFTSYVSRLFNTIRYYYDKDFLIKNQVFKKGIGKINLAGFNWLNFFISEDEKLQMFIRGAEAATEFLLQFNWKEYQEQRISMQIILNERRAPEHAT